MQLGFFGGEPLLEWDLLQRSTELTEKRCAEAGVELKKTVTTNATLLTADRVSWLDFTGKHTWLERGIEPLPYTAEDLRPKSMEEILEEREQKKSEPAKEKPAAQEELRIA